jgi:hypothetical protein
MPTAPLSTPSTAHKITNLPAPAQTMEQGSTVGALHVEGVHCYSTPAPVTGTSTGRTFPASPRTVDDH